MQAPTPHPGSIQPGATSIRRQHGSMAIAMMLMLLGLISILGIVEVGYLYWAHRDAQKVADLAALSGAQQLSGPACTTDSDAYKAALGNAADNGATGKDGKPANGYTSIDITCGRQPANGSSILAPASASSVAAIKVVANRSVNPLFGKGMAWQSTFPIKAEAVAINQQPTVVFSVGSTLASIDSNSPLNQLLKPFGTAIGLNVLSSSGIANANISLLDLINNLQSNGQSINVGTVSGVLDAPLNFAGFAKIVIDALPQGNTDPTLQAWLNDVNANVILSNATITLGDILDVDANTTDPNSALKTTISAANLLQAALLAADSKNALSVPDASISIPGIQGVPNIASADLSLQVVEPPQIGIGGAGASASTAQIKLGLNIKLLDGALPGNGSLVSLPVYIHVASATAKVDHITCGIPQDTTIFDVKTSAADAHLANYDDGQWSPAKIINVLNIASIYAMAEAPVTTQSPGNLTFTTDHNSSSWTYPSQSFGSPDNLLSHAITSLLSSKIDTTVDLLGLIPLPLPISTLLSSLSTLLQGTLLKPNSLLDGANPLDALTNPLLEELGLEVGTAQVTLLAPVNCNSGAQLVY